MVDLTGNHDLAGCHRHARDRRQHAG